ncbi:linear amide C-N hydrolase [Leucobacter sp.]
MCTRFLWSSGGSPGGGLVFVGRSMDWFEDTRTVLALRPRGERRESAAGDPGGFTWVSDYGSVVALMYGRIAVDGINEAGLQASGLYLTESDYGERDAGRPALGLQQAIQCLLDRFPTVAAAVAWLTESRVQIIPLEIGGKPGTGHISLADVGGDSAIVEFLDGRLSVHHGPGYTVMANSPAYDEQLDLQRRYAGLGGRDPLPGGTDSPDRFARAAYYSAHLPATDDPRQAAAQVFSVIRNASAPFGTVDEARPNISTTRWRTVADLSSRRYFFESTLSPNVVWVDLDRLSFEPGPDRILDLVHEAGLVGEQSGGFVAA